jgi:glycerol uptake facilitator-like aquaporin
MRRDDCGSLDDDFPHYVWQTGSGTRVRFEAVITFGLVLMVLNMADGPKLNGAFAPFAVGAYIMAWGTMGGPFDGASMNPARSVKCLGETSAYPVSTRSRPSFGHPDRTGTSRCWNSLLDQAQT